MAKEISDSNLSGLSQTPSANRIHISFFGRRNAGKSSLVNAVTGQTLSIVSDIKGTTTDPVSKAMELLPLGPVVIIDTPGIDDDGLLGEKRIEKTYQILAKTDVAILVIDSSCSLSVEDNKLITLFREKQIPFLVVLNKSDLAAAKVASNFTLDTPCLAVSALTGEGIETLKKSIGQLAKPAKISRQIIADKLSPSSIVVLVTPIDESAPKGRLILPQVQTLRDILDKHAVSMVCQTEELPAVLAALKEPPALVVTDSQAFHQVKDMVPKTVPLTSFSVLMARFKGILDTAASGAHALSGLQDGDRVLISEGCTHHRQCEDIGTVKLPDWISKYTGKKLEFNFTSGGEFPRDLSSYALVVHCGGCMLNEREMNSRMTLAETQGIPFTNYGTLIAHINGILDRSLEIFHE